MVSDNISCLELPELCKTDAVIISAPEDVMYFSGYPSDCAIIVVRDGRAQYFTDMRYIGEAEEHVDKRMSVSCGDIAKACELIKDCKRIGIDDRIYLDEYIDILEHLGRNFNDPDTVKISGVIDKMRMVKQNSELSSIRKAQEITDIAYAEILKYIDTGVTEIELAARLEYIMQKRGASPAFDTIMAFGENGAVPHAHPTFRKLKAGEMITMDFGAKVEGYCSDMTRTVGFEYISEDMEKAYDLVLTANKNAIASLKSGVRGKDLQDSIIRYFAEHGVSEYFTHSLGHGVGLRIHEPPYYKNCIFEENNIVTVEPGLYFPAKFGIRIEDMVKITQYGVENLTKSNKSLIIIRSN